MTCRELQSYCDELESTADVRQLPAAAMQHAADCDSCRCFVETRKEILARLQLLREATLAVAPSLDATVLARYRETMAVPAHSTGSHWRRLSALWRLAAISIAALVILVAITLTRKTPNPAEPHAQVPHAPDITRPKVPHPARTERPVAHRNAADVREATARKPNTAIGRHQVAVAPIRQADSQEFRSLMYCDELSCNGGMDVVRVQLPALPAGFLPAPNTPIRSVSADVLVGADGFARGIRIVH
jgi:hypothetical protein